MEKKLNKKLLKFTLTLLALSVAMTPATAKPIGPQKTNNPHIAVTPEGAELPTPSGGILSWVADTEWGAIDFMCALDASKAKGLVHKAGPLTLADIIGLMMDPEAALESENMWGYISYDVLVELLIFEGEDPAIADQWPDGIYVRFVNMGPTWDA